MTIAVADPPPPSHTEPVKRPRLAKLLRTLAIPIVIFWVLIAVITNVFLPSLDDVTADNAGPLVARDAPSAQAAIHQGNDFRESNYTSVAVLMLETKDRKLGEQDHQYYNEVVSRLLDDTNHVASVQDLWGKPVTMSGSQSADAEATTLTIRPVGDLGSSQANKSIEAIRDVVAKVPKPDGLSAYITGPAPLAADTLHATDKSTLHSLVSQLDPFINPLIDLAQAFDNAENDDFFFLPPDALKTDDFKVGMNFFMTPDGKGARIVFYHTGEAQSPQGIKQVEDVTAAAQEAVKGTSLSNAKISLAGAASNYRDVRDYSANDIIIMMLATFALVFIIVLAITRALIGAIIVLVTVMLSFAAAFGLSIFVWETLLHTQLHWLTLPIAFIVLVAVGCDYNLLLLSRYRDEIGAGVQTGLIRTMGSSRGVVFTAAFVFAFTMLALLSSDVINIGQAGLTICMGLMLDMLVVRLFLVMPLARLLGPWFWWPQRIRRRPERAVPDGDAELERVP
ncbi:MAG: hypothetical protein QOK02_6382 [Mycobacterium sp.]|nr:hypothetical protein [Mycobacterium sp.]